MTTEYLLNRELQHVLAALTPSNALVIKTILRTGLRVSDVLALKPQDLKPQMWVTEGKTRKRRQVGLGTELVAELRAQAGQHWVFPGRDPKRHRTRQAVWYDVKRASRAFRLPQNVGTHSVRKMYAVELLSRYGDVQRVQRALQHDRLTTTLVYAMADKLLQAKGTRSKRPRR